MLPKDVGNASVWKEEDLKENDILIIDFEFNFHFTEGDF